MPVKYSVNLSVNIILLEEKIYALALWKRSVEGPKD
jgi:hypothetical protein